MKLYSFIEKENMYIPNVNLQLNIYTYVYIMLWKFKTLQVIALTYKTQDQTQAVVCG